MNIGLQSGLQPVSLVHALQNHDELTYELVHFDGAHPDDLFPFRGAELTGAALARLVRAELTQRLTGPAAPYNAVFTTNGISSTTVTVVTASLGYRDIRNLTGEQIENVTRAHLLLAMFNAWQPGVFALSGWDLCGALTLDPAMLGDLVADGDTRWIHRGAYDLMNYRPDGDEQASALPRAACLYGPLPAQLADPTSFASRLRTILEIRKECRISTGIQLDVADTSDRGLLAMIHELEGGRLQATVLNFSSRPLVAHVRSQSLPPGAVVGEVRGRGAVAQVDGAHSFRLTMHPHEGRCLLFET